MADKYQYDPEDSRGVYIFDPEYMCQMSSITFLDSLQESIDYVKQNQRDWDGKEVVIEQLACECFLGRVDGKLTYCGGPEGIAADVVWDRIAELREQGPVEFPTIEEMYEQPPEFQVNQASYSVGEVVEKARSDLREQEVPEQLPELQIDQR